MLTHAAPSLPERFATDAKGYTYEELQAAEDNKNRAAAARTAMEIALGNKPKKAKKEKQPACDHAKGGKAGRGKGNANKNTGRGETRGRPMATGTGRAKGQGKTTESTMRVHPRGRRHLRSVFWLLNLLILHQAIPIPLLPTKNGAT